MRSAVAGATRRGAVPCTRRMPVRTSETSVAPVGMGSPRNLWAYRIAAARRLMVEGLRPLAASSAKKSATVVGCAGRGSRCRAEHQALKVCQSVA